MIEVEDLRKRYGRFRALNGIDFSVATGEIVGFLGPNGAGKSTTMKILTTFTPASGGRAIVAGFDVAREPERVCERIGYLPESMPLYPEMRVREYLRYRALLKSIPRAQRRSRIEQVLEECALADHRHKMLTNLSRGYRQRLGLADALLKDPEVLILDEPTSGLDPRQVTEVRRMIEGFRGQRTVLLSSHILGEIEQVCDRVVILAHGEIRFDGALDAWRSEVDSAAGVELVFVTVPGDLDRVLQGIAGVDRVERRDTVATVWGSRDLRADLFSMAKQRDWRLLELRRVTTSLESLFLEVTADRSEAAVAP